MRMQDEGEAMLIGETLLGPGAGQSASGRSTPAQVEIADMSKAGPSGQAGAQGPRSAGGGTEPTDLRKTLRAYAAMRMAMRRLSHRYRYLLVAYAVLITVEVG